MDDEERKRLQELYPTWRIRASENARCVVATRWDRLCLTPDELYLGLCMTLIEDTPTRLASALAGQAEIEATL